MCYWIHLYSDTACQFLHVIGCINCCFIFCFGTLCSNSTFLASQKRGLILPYPTAQYALYFFPPSLDLQTSSRKAEPRVSEMNGGGRLLDADCIFAYQAVALVTSRYFITHNSTVKHEKLSSTLRVFYCTKCIVLIIASTTIMPLFLLTTISGRQF